MESIKNSFLILRYDCYQYSFSKWFALKIRVIGLNIFEIILRIYDNVSRFFF